MEKVIPILLICSLLSVFNPVSVDGNQNRLYVVDISAIEITAGGAERYVPDAGISLIDPLTGREISPQQSTGKGNTYAFYAGSGDKYKVEVQNKAYQVVDGRVLDLKKVKKYAWKVVYLKKNS